MQYGWVGGPHVSAHTHEAFCGPVRGGRNLCASFQLKFWSVLLGKLFCDVVAQV